MRKNNKKSYSNSKGKVPANKKYDNGNRTSNGHDDEIVRDKTSETSNNGSDDPNPKINDPEWYSKDNQLVIDAASIPFSEPLGDTFDLNQGVTLGTYSGNTITISNKADAFAGVLTLFTKASFGFNSNIKSPLNVAAQMLYTNVRVRNSGRKNYDAPDLMMYVMSMADVYSFIVWCERIYAKAFMYSQRNKYIGEALLSSENIDHRNIVNNLANFRYWINTFINKIASYAVPTDIAYFSRRVWIYSGIYLENPDANIKDQLYQFSPDGFYRFALDDNKAGRLEYQRIPDIVGHTNAMTYTDIVSIGDWLLSNVFGDEDFALMSGDIIKAFEGRIIKLGSMSEESAIIPVYSEYVLEQFHNARFVPGLLRGSTAVDARTINGDTDTKHLSGDVFQLAANGLLYSAELITTDAATINDAEEQIDMGTKHVLDLNTPTPTPIDVMESTRLTAGFKSLFKNLVPKWYTGISAGSDIAVGCTITCYVAGLNTPSVLTLRNSVLRLDSAGLFSYNGVTIAKIATFKYAPMFKLMYVPLNGQVSEVNYFGNVNNYTLLDYSVLEKLHEVAMLSLLTVPGVAKFVNTVNKIS